MPGRWRRLAGGTLQIDDDITNIDTLKATGGGELLFDDGMNVTGGTLIIESVSQLVITAGTGAGATLDNVSVTDSNITEGIDVKSGAILTLDGGTQINSTDLGTLTIGSTGALDVETLGGSTVSTPDATIDGIIVTDGNAGGGTYTGIEIADATSGAILTLDGGTQINSTDDGTLMIGSTGTLDVETLGGSTVSTPDATIDSIIVTDGNDGDGTYNGIEISDATSGAILTLDGGATISGGTLAVELGGVLAITDAIGATLDHVVVDNDGTGTGANAGIYVASGVLTLGGDTQIQGGGPPRRHAVHRKRWPGHRRWRYRHRGRLAEHHFHPNGRIRSHVGCRQRLRLRNRRRQLDSRRIRPHQC
jgi:fibronectin-binding autotransporter adhesin